MDEICAENVSVHFERLDSSHVSVVLHDSKGQKCVRVVLWARDGKIYFGAEED